MHQLLYCFPADCNCLQQLTSRHDVAHILHCESRVLVLGVDPDDPVAQPAHGQDGPGWERSSTSTRSADEAQIKNIKKFKKSNILLIKLKI